MFYFTAKYAAFTGVKVSLTKFSYFLTKYRVTFVSVNSLLRRKQNKETETLLETENMKTTIKHLTAGTFIAFLLMVGNVNAEGTEVKASGHENIETSLQIEKWMTEEFLLNSNSVYYSEIVPETESVMVLENWMTAPESWNPVTDFTEEKDSAMELETWMTSEATWNGIKTESDSELKVENWMLGNSIL